MLAEFTDVRLQRCATVAPFERGSRRMAAPRGALLGMKLFSATPLFRKPLQKVMNEAAQEIEFVPRHRQRFCAGGRLVSSLCNVRGVCRRALPGGVGGGKT